MGYANFFQRLGAFIIDNLILTVVLFPISLLLSGIMRGDNAGPLLILIYMVIGWLYFALQESSEKQATIGKKILSIKVTNFDGNRLTFAKASGRFFAKMLSALIYGIGFIMAAFTKKKQALHDKIAGTFVVSGETGKSFFASESSQYIQDGLEKKIKQLLELKNQGILSENEFKEAKEKLLARV